MKKLLMTIVALFALSGCQNNNPTTEPTNELKVMAWNIWHAGHTEAYGEKGCEGVLGIIKKSEADVVLMIETYGASSQVADHLGFYHRLISSNLSIYSRYPIVETYTFADSISTFNFGGAEIDMNGKRVRVFDTWLHYLPDTRLAPTDKSEAEILAWENEGSRDDEVKRVLNVLKPYIAESDSIPVIIGGDFNSHSHLDWTEATKDMYNHGGAVVNWSVSKYMEQAGFKDSFRELNNAPEKNIGATWISPKAREDRIDYIYYQGGSIDAIKSESYVQDLGEVLNFYGEDFLYTSDHGFVLSTFVVR
ncbi:MAG: endonuclease/exonuclease/phosphatase family protein [Rikenellaceae bacterium]